MMIIRKIVRIENVGRFTKLVPSGDVEFRKLTLLYGENGHGKTTMAAVVRSLQTGHAAHISERATLGASGGQGIEILLGTGGVAKFANGAWSHTLSDVEIFDATFVRENVFAGDNVETEHRKNLYEVVVGASAVALRNKVDELDAKNRQALSSVRQTEQDLGGHVQTPYDLDDFLGMKADPDVEEKIRVATTKLNALRNSKAVLSRPPLEQLRLPESPRPMLRLLQTKVEQVAQEALEKVKSHIQNRLGSGGENWIRQGLHYPHDEQCPFCGQDSRNAPLLEQFSAYFSNTYDEKVIELRRAVNRLDQTLGERALAQVRQVVLENVARIQTWKDMADLSDADVSIENLEKVWRHVADTLKAKLEAKLASPTQSLGDDAVVEAALRDFEQAIQVAADHNKKVTVANDIIDKLKKDAASTDQFAVEQDLRRLRNSQIRQEPEVVKLCALLVEQRLERARLTKEKETAKEDLEKQAGDVLEKYQTSINKFLEKFGASFRMSGTKPDFTGGKASSIYKIEINNAPVDLGDSRTKPGVVCFRTALSAGDRSTLALAFFLARLERDTKLASKLVVFDDPLSSLDCFRSVCTQQEITRVAYAAAQVLVMSHDAFFLQSLHSEDGTAKTLHIVRQTGSHQMQEWNIDDHCASQAHRDFFLLKTFLNAGVPQGSDLTGIARRIRPYVEDYVRHKYPGDFDGHATLGKCIEKIKELPASQGAGAFKPKVQELEDINAFGSRFMHSSGTAVVPPSETELQAFAKRALALVQQP
jgi:wobble nucleotide-excising tRNase